MSTKDYFYSAHNVSAYQDLSLDDVNINPVEVEMDGPEAFSIEKYENNDKVKVSLTIPLKDFDQIALSWVKKRDLL